MANRYGQQINWGTVNAPHIFSGVCTHWSYRAEYQRQLDEDEGGEYRALIQHSRKAAISFDAKVTDGSTNFLDLSQGAQITVSGVTGGVSGSIILASKAVERWTLSQPKTASVQATHYLDMVVGADTTYPPTAAGITNTAITPTQALSWMYPGSKLVYGTAGIVAPTGTGIVHSLEVTQELTITEDEPDPTGGILGATTHGYMRTMQMDLLATGTIPAIGSVLSVTGTALANTAGYRIETAETVFTEKRGSMFRIGAIWLGAAGFVPA